MFNDVFLNFVIYCSFCVLPCASKHVYFLCIYHMNCVFVEHYCLEWSMNHYEWVLLHSQLKSFSMAWLLWKLPLWRWLIQHFIVIILQNLTAKNFDLTSLRRLELHILMPGDFGLNLARGYSVLIFTSAKEVIFLSDFVCLFVCLFVYVLAR